MFKKLISFTKRVYHAVETFIKKVISSIKSLFQTTSVVEEEEVSTESKVEVFSKEDVAIFSENTEKVFDRFVKTCAEGIETPAADSSSEISSDDFYIYLPNHERISKPRLVLERPALYRDGKIDYKFSPSCGGSKIVLVIKKSNQRMAWCEGERLTRTHSLGDLTRDKVFADLDTVLEKMKTSSYQNIYFDYQDLSFDVQYNPTTLLFTISNEDGLLAYVYQNQIESSDFKTEVISMAYAYSRVFLLAWSQSTDISMYDEEDLTLSLIAALFELLKL